MIFAVLNMVLQGVATYMLYHYMYNSPKRQYREVSLILVIIGVFLVSMCLAAYLPMVGLQLQSIRVNVPGVSLILNNSQANGISIGYWLMWVSVLLQIVQLVLFKYSKISEERRLVELKMQEQFEAELAVG